MKLMRYIVLLNILVSTISMHAGRGAAAESKRPGLKFPEGRVHRFLVKDRQLKLQSDQMKREAALYYDQRDKVNREMEQLDKQVDEKVAEILAVIDPSTLEALDLEALD